jgi:2-amino-4-hydroxy-6-hydroxymethyldihydropteridine diphosphokinase
VCGQQWFINAAAIVHTMLEPEALLEFLLEVERKFGRVRTVKWGPRTLDLDILLYEDMQIDLPGLKVPHPLMSERLFVLQPLAEIEPNWLHPGLGLSINEMLSRIIEKSQDQEIQKLEE